MIFNYKQDEAEQMILDQNAESSAAVSKSKTISEAFSQETNEENKKFNIDSETDEEEINAGLTFPLFIDENDYRETTLDDAIKDKNHPLSTEWPSNIYRQFMEIVTEYQLPNSCGDRLIKLFNSIENVDKICFQNLPKRAKNSLITVIFLI